MKMKHKILDTDSVPTPPTRVFMATEQTTLRAEDKLRARLGRVAAVLPKNVCGYVFEEGYPCSEAN